jgi:MoaA/NifB/PqqE/SkfB family radical SAM enzyme
MDNINKLEKYVCEEPFLYTDVHTHGQFVCCPAWGPPNIKVDTSGNANAKLFNESDDVHRNWTSDVAYDIRKSVYDGSYSVCNHDLCPKLNQLKNSNIIPEKMLLKEEFEKKYNIRTLEDLRNFSTPPEEILFGFDRSCNLQCPSCRVSLVTNDNVESKAYKNKLHILKSIEDSYGSNLKRILVTGSGDPFYSTIYRQYLQNFDKSKYPNLESLQIITNGVILNEKMWNSLQAAPYIKFIEISIDAGNKNTYENVTRLNGDWDRLISNLKFIATLDTVDDIVCSFVVSKNNYKEMKQFYNLITDIFRDFKNKLGINYRQIANWWTYKYEELKELQVFEEENSDFYDFLIELKKIHDLPFVNHNFHHIISKYPDKFIQTPYTPVHKKHNLI